MSHRGRRHRDASVHHTLRRQADELPSSRRPTSLLGEGTHGCCASHPAQLQGGPDHRAPGLVGNERPPRGCPRLSWSAEPLANRDETNTLQVRKESENSRKLSLTFPTGRCSGGRRWPTGVLCLCHTQIQPSLLLPHLTRDAKLQGGASRLFEEVRLWPASADTGYTQKRSPQSGSDGKNPNKCALWNFLNVQIWAT